MKMRVTVEAICEDHEFRDNHHLYQIAAALGASQGTGINKPLTVLKVLENPSEEEIRGALQETAGSLSMVVQASKRAYDSRIPGWGEKK